MKRKTALLLIILAAVVLTAGTALANEYTDPYRQDMLAFHREMEAFREAHEASGGPVSNGTLSGAEGYIDGPIKLTVSGSKLPQKTLTFKVTFTDGSDPSDYEFYWGITDRTWDSSGYLLYSHGEDGMAVGRSTLKYKFWTAGEYSMFLRITPLSGGDSGGYAYIYFTIADDGEHPTMDEKAREIVNECKGSSKWETALNLYDWLTENCYYDSTLEAHGLDSFFTGYGVCDSFSKCYTMLLNTAGIPAARAFGPNHAWNVLQLGGEWYQADPTWDIGGSYKPGEGVKKDGGEDHEYFCVNEKAMKSVSSHHYDDGSQEGPHVTECTSMAANYFVKTGEWKDFGNYVSLDDESYEWVSAADQARFYLEDGQTEFKISAYSGHVYQSGIMNEILQAGLAGEKLLDGEKVLLSMECSDEWGKYAASLEGWNIKETGTLKLPWDLKTVTNQAYAKTGATTVIIRASCTSIGSGAFRYSKVRTVKIPDSVTEIAADAFEGCGKLIFITKNKTAIKYARKHGYPVIAP